MEINSNWFSRWFLSFKGEGIESNESKKNSKMERSSTGWSEVYPKINTLKVKKDEF